MTREHKLALILGFSVVLVVGVLISDHFSDATVAQLENLDADAVLGSDAQPAPMAQTHAAAPSNDTMPGGFLIDGQPQPTVVAAANPTVFRSSSEALLSEIQRSWRATQGAASGALDQVRNAAPAAEIDRPATTPIAALIPEPTLVPERATRSNPIESSNDAPTKSHRVSEDESLWSIAQAYYGDGALYMKLAAFNKGRVGEDGAIRVGEVLRIPPRAALTGERRTTAKPKKTRTASPRTYTVRDGDTLGEIAQRLLGSSSKWREIVELNGIEDPDVVPVGTTLKLPAAR